MELQRLFEHARQCRVWAKELRGNPDSDVLTHIAHEFEAIAAEKRAAIDARESQNTGPD